MTAEELKKVRIQRRELRKFGTTIGVFLGLLGGLFFWKGRYYYPPILVLSFLFLSGGLFFPDLLKPVHKVWMTAAMVIGRVVTRIILAVLFYLVVTPLGLCMRIWGKNLLDLKFDKKSTSYWIKRDTAQRTKDIYEKQF